LAAANYFSVGQIYVKEHALLEEPRKLEHIKLRLLGRWSTTPELIFLYIHLNRLTKEWSEHDVCHWRGRS
jgi:xylulose-5-phosphate/fructose-6-phosphate phosphoketolase